MFLFNVANVYLGIKFLFICVGIASNDDFNGDDDEDFDIDCDRSESDPIDADYEFVLSDIPVRENSNCSFQKLSLSWYEKSLLNYYLLEYLTQSFFLMKYSSVIILNVKKNRFQKLYELIRQQLGVGRGPIFFYWLLEQLK